VFSGDTDHCQLPTRRHASITCAELWIGHVQRDGV
jgi:hypothetical protein